MSRIALQRLYLENLDFGQDLLRKFIEYDSITAANIMPLYDCITAGNVMSLYDCITAGNVMSLYDCITAGNVMSI